MDGVLVAVAPAGTALTASGMYALPKGITEIASYVFASNTEIQSAFLTRDGFKTIGEGAFGGCTNLSWVLFSDDIESIGRQAFIGCPKLELLQTTEKSKLKFIGSEAFSYCPTLATTTKYGLQFFMPTPPTLEEVDGVVKVFPVDCRIMVKSANLETYQNDTVWKAHAYNLVFVPQ